MHVPTSGHEVAKEMFALSDDDDQGERLCISRRMFSLTWIRSGEKEARVSTTMTRFGFKRVELSLLVARQAVKACAKICSSKNASLPCSLQLCSLPIVPIRVYHPVTLPLHL